MTVARPLNVEADGQTSVPRGTVLPALINGAYAASTDGSVPRCTWVIDADANSFANSFDCPSRPMKSTNASAAALSLAVDETEIEKL